MASVGKFNIILALIVALLGLLYHSLDEVRRLIKVGGNFTTKNVCAGVFVSTMSPNNMLEFELQGLAGWLFKFNVDFSEKSVEAYVVSKSFSRLTGLAISKSYFIESRGCLFLSSKSSVATATTGAEEDIAIYSKIDYDSEIQSFLNYQVSPSAFQRNQTRGTLVLHNGVIVGEAYQSKELNLGANSRLLGWSMTKTVHAMMIGAAIQQGLLTLDTPVKLEGLDPVYLQSLIARNHGKSITFRDLITMSDILPCKEDYEFTNFVPDMLFGSRDHGLHATSCSVSDGDDRLPDRFTRQINKKGIGRYSAFPSIYKSFNYNVTSSNFDFYYSSSLSNLLARELRLLFKSDEEYLQFPHKYLFGPIGASSFIVETDNANVFVASSFGYATPRDWAKLGDLLRTGGVSISDGTRVISKEFVDFMLTARAFSGGHYGGSIWLNPARIGVGEYNYLGSDNKDKKRFGWMTRAVPHDAAIMSGFNGQYVMIIPSLKCVIVRLGFTPGVWDTVLDEDEGKGDMNGSVVPFDSFEFFGALSKHCMRLNEKQ